MSSEITSKGIESTAEMVAVLKNTSEKPIMAFEAITDLFPSYGGGDRVTTRVDYFFDDPLAPGGKSEIDMPERRIIVFWSRAEHPADLKDISEPPQPRADVSVTFVQFVDGTTFGDSQWAAVLPLQRDNLLATMQTLERAFDSDGEEGLKSGIEKAETGLEPTSELYSALGPIQKKFREDGASATVQYLRRAIANAQNHSNPTSVVP